MVTQVAPLIFSFIVDYFGIDYVEERYSKHLLATLEEHYTFTTYWKRNNCAGIDLHWDLKHRICRLSMEGYIQ